MSTSSTGFETDASVSGITECHVLVDHLPPFPPIYPATSHRANVLLPFRRIAGSDTPVLCRESAGVELQDTIGEPDVYNDF